MTQVVQIQQDGQTQLAKIEQVLINGDLSKLTEGERLSYYKNVCISLGLNPLTKPFDYITLSGKLTLYARKDATEQLRKIHSVSIYDVAKEVIDDVFIVTAKARDMSGREDTATGAVTVAGLKGEAKANAMMKAETKAKRRVTLSICGLGMLDESEVDSIPAEEKAPGRVFADQPGENDGVKPPSSPTKPKSGSMKGKSLAEFSDAELHERLEYLFSINAPSADQLREIENIQHFLDTLNQIEPPAEDDVPPVQGEKPRCTCGSSLILSTKKNVYYCANFKDASQQHIRSIPKADYERM